MQNKKVLVVGCGGLGCYSVEYLARLGVGKILVADGDVFNKSNMNRQLYCTKETLLKEKALVASERWPNQVISYVGNVNSKNIKKLVDGCDVVIDALDSVESRRIVADACEKLSVPMIYGAIGDTFCQCCVIYPGDKDILDILYPTDNVQRVPTVSYTPACCSSMQVALAHRILLNDFPDRRKLYITDLKSMEFSAMAL